MNEKQNMKSLKELNLTDRFLFDEVMEDIETHHDILSIIFGRDIPLLEKSETEKEFRLSPSIRSIRMDIFSIDENQTVYNTEMQAQRRSDLAKRSRYYQSLLDTSLLEPGIPDYNLLNLSYIIVIMTFDYFGYGKYLYTFEPRYLEVPECPLEDGATRIFLNTEGKNDTGVSEELIDFLNYIKNSTDETAAASGSERIHRIHNRVCKVRTSEEVGVRYMQAWEEKYYERQENLKEGLQKGRKLQLSEQVQKKLAKNKTPEEIADALEESVETIQKMIQEISKEAE